MSRTEQFTLPRIPTSHARITSPGALTHHSARSMRSGHRPTRTEPSYTAYVGTPRQDLPVHVFRDAAMYEGVFDREGRFSRRATPKYHAPLDTLDYNGLHDPHCRRLYLNNRHLREHLVNLGLLTEDLKVVASTKEQRQKIRAHEMLEKKEQLMETMEDRESRRLNNMMKSSKLPHIAHWSHQRAAERQAQTERRAQRQRQRLEQAKETANTDQEELKLQQKLKWEKFVREQELQQQKERNAEKLVQKDAEMVKYINRFGMSTDDADVAEVEGERERGYLRQVEETARYLRQSREETSESGKQEKETEPDSELQKMLEPKVDEAEGVVGGVIAEALQAVVSEGFTVQEEEEGRESKVTVADEEKQAAAAQDEEKGPSSPVQTPVAPGEVTPVRKGEGLTSQPAEGVAAPKVAVQGERPTSEQSRQLLAEFVITLAASADETQNGYVSSNDFIQLLGSREVGLRLTEDELYQVVAFLDPDSSGWVPYFEASTSMREVLLAIYSARAVENRPSSAGSEEAWLPMYTPLFGYLYLNSVDGQAQRERPAIFRPYLADDVFEDTIVDFFESADIKGDHVLDEDEFREFLFSPTVTEQLYEEQKEDLIGLFSASTTSHMTLEEFVPLARTMITMVYRRHYEGPSTDEWLELSSNKFGAFWLNKNTGETLFPQEMQGHQSPGSIPSADFTRQSSNQFGTDELPSLGEFTTSRPSTFPYAHTVVPHAAPMVYHTFAPPPASHHGERTKKRKLKKKQKTSSFSEEDGSAPPPLRPRTREYVRQQRATVRSTPSSDAKQEDGTEPQHEPNIA